MKAISMIKVDGKGYEFPVGTSIVQEKKVTFLIDGLKDEGIIGVSFDVGAYLTAMVRTKAHIDVFIIDLDGRIISHHHR